jgi:hypothetical protein
MSERRFGSAVRDLGHRNFGHSIYRPGHEPDHVSMEAAMGNIEGEAATVVRELVQSRERTVPAVPWPGSWPSSGSAAAF